MAVTVALAGLALVRPAPAYDAEASGLLRSAVEPGIEGWFQYYLSPHEATAQGIKLAMRYHHGHGRAECGLSLPAHLERTRREPEPGLQLRHGDRRRFVLFQVRAS